MHQKESMLLSVHESIIFVQSVRLITKPMYFSPDIYIGPKIVFIVLRQQLYTIQGVLTEETDMVSENMVRWAEGLGREAIVLIEGKMQLPPPNQGEIKSTTVHQREVKIEKVSWVAEYAVYHLMASSASCHCASYNPPSFPS
jgi:aspartyl/asparaginyl-tRNA synthetase